MSLFVKVCGVSQEETVATCIEAGVDAIGFVMSSSPRQISPERAVSLARAVPAGIATVAVFRRPSPDEIDRVLDVFTPDMVQADAVSLADRAGVTLLPVYREGEHDGPVGGRYLYESPISGEGRQVDLDRAAVMARTGEMILAGGLTPENVVTAVDRVRPFGVDVSSGVENAPGVKEPGLIRSFVSAARAVDERMVSS